MDWSTVPRKSLDPSDIEASADVDAAWWHERLNADPLLPDCSGTHSLGYGYCQRLAANRAESGLDVERLARALTTLDPHEVGYEDGQLIHVSTDATYEQSRSEWAHAIAAEYARLGGKR